MSYGQFGEKAKLNLPEEIEMLRSTVTVVGNNLVMMSAEDRINVTRVKEPEDDEGEDGPHSPFGRVDGYNEVGNAGLVDGISAQILEGEDEEPDSPTHSEAHSKPITFVGVESNSGLLQVNLLAVDWKKDDSRENISNVSADALTRDVNGSEKLRVGSKLNSADCTRNMEDSKAFEDENRGKEGVDMEEKTVRRVSRRKMYRASRIGTPFLKGALEEVVRLSLEEDKVPELQDNRDEWEEEQGLSGGHLRAPTEEQKNSHDVLSQKMQRRAILSLPQKSENEEQQKAGPDMSSFDVLAGEFLKASVVLETAEADSGGSGLHGKEGEISVPRGSLTRVTSGEVAIKSLEFPKDEMGVSKTMPGINISAMSSKNFGFAADEY